MAASRGPEFLKASINGYAKALTIAGNQPLDRRYDVSRQMEQWVMAGHLLTQSAWDAWGDVRRLNLLAPYVTPDEYEVLSDEPLGTGKEHRWQLLNAAIDEGKLVWDEKFKELFLEGVEQVGAPAMHRFVGRERSPKVLAGEDYESFGGSVKTFMDSLNAQQRDLFIKRVLVEVPMDKSVDENNSNGRAQFFQLIRDLNRIGPKWRSVLGDERSPDAVVDTLQDQLFRKEGAFQSWSQFKRVRGLLLFRKHRNLLSAIASLDDGTEEGRRIDQYLSALILHPGSSDFKAVEEFVAALKDNNPSFFDREDINADVLHDKLKPSRYFQFLRIDLTPQRLARGLIFGLLDKIQTFQPHSLEYYPSLGFSLELNQMNGKDLVVFLLGQKEVDKESLKRGLLTVLGNRKEALRLSGPWDEMTESRVRSFSGAIQNAMDWVNRGMKGTAPKIFSHTAVSKLVSLESLTAAGLKWNCERYRLRILPKSDPLASLTGNATLKCNRFGTGKNGLFVLHPLDAIFILSKEIEGVDGLPQERILTASLVTLDRGVPTNVAEDSHLLLQRKELSLSARDLFGEDFLEKISLKSYVGVNNVEAAPSVFFNGEESGFEKLIEEGYRQFFNDYLRHHPLTPGGRPMDREQVPVGVANSDFLFHLKKAGNLFYRQAYNSYSDMIGESVGLLLLDGRNTSSSPLSPMEQEVFVRPLLAEDIVEVSYLENVAFKPVHKDFAEVQNEMIAALLNEAVQGRDREFLGLGLFHRGRLAGYVLAYAGVSPGRDGEEILVSDFAVLPNTRGITESDVLIDPFLERVQNHARYRASNGKETFLVIDANSAEEGLFQRFQLSPKKAFSMSLLEIQAWEHERDVWMEQWGLSFLKEGGSVSDRAAIRIKVTPTESRPGLPKGIPGQDSAGSIFDPLLQAGAQRLTQLRWASAAYVLDQVRRAWNFMGGPYVEVALGAVSVAHWLVPLWKGPQTPIDPMIDGTRPGPIDFQNRLKVVKSLATGA
ncbi:MAG: hypothetical protein IPN90_07895 [Elusimicrobia bacterium]|nr:hypothetical protein [Elusimicrobiota bacterium]